MKQQGLIILLIVLGMSSCFKDDSPIKLPPQGDAEIQTLHMGSDYGTQFFYDLANARIVHSSKVNSWHLAFESGKYGDGIFMNCGRGMALVQTEKSDFGSITKSDFEDETWIQDSPDGLKTGSGFGLWSTTAELKDKIFVVRLDPNGKQIVTIKLSEVTETHYRFDIGNLTEGYIKSVNLVKDPTRVYTYYDLNNLERCADIEPVKESWDIVFTRYGFTFYDQNPPLPYIVTGVLANPETMTYKDTVSSFYEINEDILPTSSFKQYRDVIGFDWKFYDFDLGLYHIKQHYNYIIRTQSDQYYKLRFLSFYDDFGLKGSPTFEFKRIK